MADDAEDVKDDETPETEVDPIKALEAKWEEKFAAQAASHSESIGAMGNRLAEVTGGYNALLASQQAGNKAPVTEALVDVPDEEIEAALEAGEWKKAAQLQRKQAQIEAKRQSAVLMATEINPLRGTVENVGLPAMGRLTDRAVRGDLPPAALEFYTKNKAAIDGHLAKMPPEARVDADAITGAIAYELGLAQLRGGLDTTINDEVERRIRAGNQPGNLKTGGGRQAGSQATDWEKIFGAGGAAAAEDAGGWDHFAQKMGYDDMQDYAIKTGVLKAGVQ